MVSKDFPEKNVNTTEKLDNNTEFSVKVLRDFHPCSLKTCPDLNLASMGTG